MRRRVAVGSAIVTLTALAVFARPGGDPARAERVQKGNLIVSLNGGISPRKLPRDRVAPAAISLAGEVRTADGSPVPRVKKVELGLSGHGLLDTRGLPVCPRARLRNSSNAQAQERCGPALVGRGRIDAQVTIPHQAPFTIHAPLLAFNGRTENGGTAIWVHAFSADPPVAIVLPSVVRRRPGAFRTALTISIPSSVGPLPHLARFQITLSRRFSSHGRRRSYLSASCPIPANFTAGFLSFARATYSFAGGRTLRTEAVRGCRAR